MGVQSSRTLTRSCW